VRSQSHCFGSDHEVNYSHLLDHKVALHLDSPPLSLSPPSEPGLQRFTARKPTDKLAGTQRERRFSKEGGGLFYRMFGGSERNDSPIDPDSSSTPPGSPSRATTTTASPESSEFPAGVSTTESRSSTGSSSTNGGRKSLEGVDMGGDKKRRSSGVGTKAAAMFASAKQSLHFSRESASGAANPNVTDQSSIPDSAFKKLGKTDPALSVPQGSLNNSAGESHPTAHSTFRVGVTEDRNKKCRRTMEDTHAYLYNFLSTPAPDLKPSISNESAATDSDIGAKDSPPLSASTSSLLSPAASNSAAASKVAETDNGYFAIFDGHAGTFAADWCGKKLHVLLEDAIRTHPNAAIPELLDQTFTSVDQQLQKLPLKNSGCTAICAVLRWEDRIPNPQSATGSTAIAPVAAAVVKANESSAAAASTNNVNSNGSSSSSNGDGGPPPTASLAIPASISALPSNITSQTALPKLQESASRQRVLYTANVGDARIVLCRNGKALRLSYDHKGSDENEGRRITNAGGMILNNRVNGVLAVTRALGDAYMKDLVTGHPYTTETVIQPDLDEFLILACDGVCSFLLCSAKICVPVQSSRSYVLAFQSPQPTAPHPNPSIESMLTYDPLPPALGRLHRPRRRRPDPPRERPATGVAAAGRARAGALQHRQPVLHGRALRPHGAEAADLGVDGGADRRRRRRREPRRRPQRGRGHRQGRQGEPGRRWRQRRHACGGGPDRCGRHSRGGGGGGRGWAWRRGGAGGEDGSMKLERARCWSWAREGCDWL